MFCFFHPFLDFCLSPVSSSVSSVLVRLLYLIFPSICFALHRTSPRVPVTLFDVPKIWAVVSGKDGVWVQLRLPVCSRKDKMWIQCSVFNADCDINIMYRPLCACSVSKLQIQDAQRTRRATRRWRVRYSRTNFVCELLCTCCQGLFFVLNAELCSKSQCCFMCKILNVLWSKC